MSCFTENNLALTTFTLKGKSYYPGKSYLPSKIRNKLRTSAETVKIIAAPDEEVLVFACCMAAGFSSGNIKVFFL